MKRARLRSLPRQVPQPSVRYPRGHARMLLPRRLKDVLQSAGGGHLPAALAVGIWVCGARAAQAVVVDMAPAASLAITTTGAPEAIAITSGPVIDGAPTIQVSSSDAAFETVQFANKSAVTIATSGGADLISINVGTAAAGLSSLTVDAGGDGDAIALGVLNLPGARVSLQNTGTVSDANGAAPNVSAASLGVAASAGVGAGDAIEVAVANLEAQTNTGGLFFASAGPVTVGGVSSALRGLSAAASGSVLLQAAGSITLADAIEPANVNDPAQVHAGNNAGDVTLIAQGEGSDITATVNRDAVTAPAGSTFLSAGRDIALGTTGFQYDNDVRARGNVEFAAGRDIRLSGYSDVSAGDFGVEGTLQVNARRSIVVNNDFGDDASLGSTRGDAFLGTGQGGRVTLVTPFTAAFADEGALTISADQMRIASSVIAAGTVTLQPASASAAIDLGPESDSAPSTLELSSAELGLIITPLLQIGSPSGTGGIRVSSSVSAPTAATVELRGQGAFVGPGSIEATRLALSPSSTAARTYDVAANAVSQDGAAPLAFSASTLILNGGEGRDTYNVRASATTVVSIDGNAPAASPGDTLLYNAEGRTVTGSGAPSGALSSPGVANVSFQELEMVTVTNSPPPTLSIADAARPEGNSGTASLPFTVTQSYPSAMTTTLDYATSDGTATQPSDYTRASGTLTIAPGQTTVALGVPIAGDTLSEDDEVFGVTLSNLANAVLGDGSATGTILDDDALPVLSLGSASVAEGNSGTTPLTLTATLSAASGRTVRARFSTTNGTAVAPEDFEAATGTLTFAPGEVSKGITILVRGDAIAEGDEAFGVVLSELSNATAGTDGTGTITDDDSSTLSLSVVPTTFSEGAGARAAVGTVTRDTQDNAQAAVISLASSNTAAATVPARVTIPAGARAASFDIAAVNDDIVDGSQATTISAVGTGFANPSAASQVLVVTDDDVAALALSITPSTLAEGSTATGTLRRNTPPTGALTVALSSSDPSRATVPATVTIAAGQSSATFAVLGVDDALARGAASVTIAATAEGLAPAQSRLAFQDNDAPALSLSVLTSTLREGASATATVKRNTPTASALSVLLRASSSSITIPASVVIAAGSDSATFAVAAPDNAQSGGSQDATISASAEGLAPASAAVAVTDDDEAALTLSITPSELREGGAPSTATVTRNTATASPLTVNLSSDDATEATTPPTVTIAAGEASATFLVWPVDDSLVDGTQSVMISASASGLAAARASVTVADNDTTPPPANQAPLAAADFYSTSGRVITVAAPGVLANDRDPEGSPLSAVLVRVPQHGTVSLRADGSFVYTPIASYAGTDTFAYAASDGKLQSQPQTVTLRVGAPRDTTPPFVAFQGGVLRVLPRLTRARGTAADVYIVPGKGAVTASGLRDVVLQLQRADGQYWNGRAYQRAPFSLRAALDRRLFVGPLVALPPSLAGRYLFTAIATDRTGNAARARQIVIVDSTPPAVRIKSPQARSGVATVARFSGVTALCSLDTVKAEATIRRSDGLYFNGRRFQAAPVRIPLSRTPRTRPDTWGVSLSIPSGEARYVLTVQATDAAGNVGRATQTIVVQSSPRT